MDALESLQQRLREARELFQDEQRTQFIIVTIPTVMALKESSRWVFSGAALGTSWF